MAELAVRTYLPSAEDVKLLSWVPNFHYGGLFAMLKLTLERILPDHVRNIIFLDTDVLLLDDIYELWGVFKEMSDGQCLAMTENQSGMS